MSSIKPWRLLPLPAAAKCFHSGPEEILQKPLVNQEKEPTRPASAFATFRNRTMYKISSFRFFIVLALLGLWGKNIV
jgi:hypothetical protein